MSMIQVALSTIGRRFHRYTLLQYAGPYKCVRNLACFLIKREASANKGLHAAALLQCLLGAHG